MERTASPPPAWLLADTCLAFAPVPQQRNRADGWVEILAIGEAAAVAALERACADGPPAARVVAVRRGEGEDDGSRGFRQRETA